MQMRALTTK